MNTQLGNDTHVIRGLNKNPNLIIDDRHELDHNKLNHLMRNVLSSFRRQLIYDNKMSEAEFESYLDTTVAQIESLIEER
jgi:hypothetical protein